MKKYFSILFSFLSLAVNAQRPSFDRLMLRSPVEDQSEIHKGENIEEKIKKNFFLKAEVSKTTCYVGEPVMATFKAFSRLNANSRVVRRPALTGFSVLEMVDAYNKEPEVEMLNGKAFNTHLIRKVQLFPLQEGKFSLEPAEVESQIYLRNPDTVRNLTLETPSIDITVKPLPLKDQPDSFSGAVGNLTASLEMKEREIYQNEPALVKLIISGTGNFPLITDPDISWPEGADVSSPRVEEDVNKYNYPLSGSKIFTYTLETNRPGDYVISPVKFAYFDPATGKYKFAVTGEIKFTVKKGRKKAVDEENIIRNNDNGFPIQYYYFAVVVLAIGGWIVFQVVRSSGKK